VSGEPRTFRIGEVAARTGTTPRTIRYYEEIGLLPAEGERASGAHRVYDEEYVERLEEVLRLKELLGVSLDELRQLITAERARAALRDEWHSGAAGVSRQREILDEALGHAERQLELLAHRRDEIARLEKELKARRKRILARQAEIERSAPV
jgi:DNA-binding transcriptional MerR regulator